MRLISPVALFLSLVASSLAFQCPILPTSTRRGGLVAARGPRMVSSEDYLSTLSSVKWLPPTVVAPRPPPAAGGGHPGGVAGAMTFAHAPLSSFSVDKLTPKGPRAGADVGQPHDAAKSLATGVDAIKAGSWWCAAGGWPSPNLRPTTEVFYVFTGSGCLTDLDGMRHPFGPGDTVILPKGWSGRWDVTQDIHKVWVTHDHPAVQGAPQPYRAVIVPPSGLSAQALSPKGVRSDATHGAPSAASGTVYDVGPTAVGGWSITPGSWPVSTRSTTEFFHVFEGVFFLTNADGSARRCGPGDTVVLPKGWSGYWDVIQTVRKLWVVVE